MEKIEETKRFKNLSPFQPYLGKSGQTSAADLSRHLHFYSAPFAYATEESASCEHWALGEFHGSRVSRGSWVPRRASLALKWATHVNGEQDKAITISQFDRK